MANTTDSRPGEPGITIYTFATSSEAWTFMHECEGRGQIAGYPSLQAPYTVKVITGTGVEHGTVL